MTVDRWIEMGLGVLALVALLMSLRSRADARAEYAQEVERIKREAELERTKLELEHERAIARTRQELSAVIGAPDAGGAGNVLIGGVRRTLPVLRDDCETCEHWNLERGQAAMKQALPFMGAAQHISPAVMARGGQDGGKDLPPEMRWEDFGACAVHNEGRWKHDRCEKWQLRAELEGTQIVRGGSVANIVRPEQFGKEGAVLTAIKGSKS